MVSDADSACFLVHTTVGDEANAFQLEVKVFLTSLEMREDKAEEEASEGECEPNEHCAHYIRTYVHTYMCML